MNLKQKLGFGLASFLVAAVAGFVFFGHKAMAAGFPEVFQSDANTLFKGVKYTFVGSKIHATITDIVAQDQRQVNLTFTDSNPNDNNHEYLSDQTIFCYDQTNLDQGAPAKITFPGSSWQPSAKTLSGRLTVYVFNGGSACGGFSNRTISVDAPNGVSTDPTNNPTPKTITWSFNSAKYTQIDPALNLYGLSTNKTNGCYGGSVLVKTSSSKGIIYSNLTHQAAGSTALTPLSNALSAQQVNAMGRLIGGCYFKADANQSGTPVTLSANGTASGDPAGGQDEADDSESCEVNALGWSFAWAFCPLLEASQRLAEELIDLFEGQLSFRVENLNNQNDGEASVHRLWALIKNIASALVIILMLVMVFSQAVSWGPFDAYSVRKMLPKLVAAVILMQISWDITAWVINAVDDIGNGLKEIMAYPFGGVDKLDFWGLMDNANIGTGKAIFISLLGTLAAGVLLFAALPTVLFFAFTAITSLFVGLAVLIFRKVLILLLLIFAPIALLAWVLPGTERYWKLWQDNFLKVLFMFPLAIAMIMGGRIMAYVAGEVDTSVFINFIIIMVGFFGPLFILPKTFRWGGSLMQAAGGSIQSFSRGVNKVSEQPIKGVGQRWQGEGAKAYDPAASRWNRALRRVQSGHFIPSVPGLRGAAERSRRLTIAAGDKWAGERNDEADAYVSRVYEKSLSQGYNRRMTDENGNYLSVRRNNAGRMLDADGNEVDSWRDAELLYRGADRSRADIERLTGVAAGKQALIDIAGNSGNSVTDQRAAQSAHKRLLDTHSEIELQDARIQGGAHEGRRVTEVASWRDTLENSPPHYSAITNSRPDQAPDVIESAQETLGYSYDDAYSETDPATKAARVRALDVERLKTTLKRMSPEGLASSHYGLFQDIARTGDAGLSESLHKLLVSFRDSGSPIGANAVGSLLGGKQRHVNDALAEAGVTIEGLVSRRGGGGAAAPEAEPEVVHIEHDRPPQQQGSQLPPGGGRLGDPPNSTTTPF